MFFNGSVSPFLQLVVDLLSVVSWFKDFMIIIVFVSTKFHRPEKPLGERSINHGI